MLMSKLKTVIAVVLVLGFMATGAPCSQLDHEVKGETDKPKTPAEHFQELIKDFNAAQEKFEQMVNASKTPEERKKIMERNPATTFAPRFLDLAKAHPKDAAALDALTWVLTNLDAGPVYKDVLVILAKDHLANSRMKRIVLHHYGQLGGSLEPGVEKFLRAVMNKSPDKDTQGLACYALGRHLKLRAEWKRDCEGSDEKTLARMEKEYGKDFIEKLRQGSLDELSKEVEQAFAMVAEKYADMKLQPSRDKTFASLAKSELYEIHHLSIGNVAPEIEGEDVEGRKFKLSDYRGKIVVLDFWAEW